MNCKIELSCVVVAVLVFVVRTLFDVINDFGAQPFIYSFFFGDNCSRVHAKALYQLLHHLMLFDKRSLKRTEKRWSLSLSLAALHL